MEESLHFTCSSKRGPLGRITLAEKHKRERRMTYGGQGGNADMIFEE